MTRLRAFGAIDHLRLGLAASAALGGLASACARPANEECRHLSAAGTWQLELEADSEGHYVVGIVSLGSTDRVELTRVSADGAREPLDFPVDGLRISGDSVSFRFAPIGYSLKGTCVAPDSVVGRFSVPQPPFEDIEGDFTMTRQR